MQQLGDMRRHLRLVSRMAQTVGADIAGAFEAGDLSSEDWVKLVHSCRQCSWTEGCEEWLDRNPEVACPPDQCRNRACLAALHRLQPAE